MARYKIADLENLSNIKAHTIRIWEQRYSLLNPLRTSTNIRYYDDKQLKKLLKVASLLKFGLKISAISQMSEKAINEKIESIQLLNVQYNEVKEDILINQLISSGLTYDEQSFEQVFSKAVMNFGLLDAYLKIFYPILVRIGFLWSTSELNPAQEHFISNLLKKKILSGIDALDGNYQSKEKWVLFLPENEDHEIGLLMAYYILKSKGKQVIYLGSDVPFENMIEVVSAVKASKLLFFVVKNKPIELLQTFLSGINKSLNQLETYMCCEKKVSEKLSFFDHQKPISSIDEYMRYLA